MTFKAQIETDFTVFLNVDEFADAAVYTPSGGDPVDVYVVLSEESSDRPGSITYENGIWILPVERDARFSFRDDNISRTAAVFVKESDVASPAYRDTIEISGVTWSVKEVFDHA